MIGGLWSEPFVTRNAARIASQNVHEKVFATEPDFAGFDKWVKSRYHRADDYVRYAHKHWRAIFDTSLAAKLNTLNPRVRHHAMCALSALSRYMGCYAMWTQVRKEAGLKWNEQKSIDIIQTLLNNDSHSGFEWAAQAIGRLVCDGLRSHGAIIVFLALTGLRVGEGLKAAELIIRLSEQNQLCAPHTDRHGYYDRELSLLSHIKYPETFMRDTKNCYVSFVSERIINLIIETRPQIAYETLRHALLDRGLTNQLKVLRKSFGTHLKDNQIPTEIIDLLQGRLPASVFARHYYRPALMQIRDRVLETMKPIEDKLLAASEEGHT